VQQGVVFSTLTLSSIKLSLPASSDSGAIIQQQCMHANRITVGESKQLIHTP